VLEVVRIRLGVCMFLAGEVLEVVRIRRGGCMFLAGEVLETPGIDLED